MDLGFPWDTLQAVIGGASAIDLSRLELRTEDEALGFLEAYGYDWHRPDDRACLDEIRAEAIDFIHRELLNPDEPRVPHEIQATPSVPVLLVQASTGTLGTRPWVCALLRVMHAICHSRNLLDNRHASAIADQILGRFEPHIHGEGDDLTLGQPPNGIPLESFALKRSKSRASLVMKLLHKAENVAADVFDHVGVRIVTRKRFDALRAIRYLRTHHVFMFANVKPSRSLNSLIDLDQVRQISLEIECDFAGACEEEKVAAMQARVQALPFPASPPERTNPFSASTYRSIQFTCRQLVRIEAFGEERRFFFPFEVQVLDTDALRIGNEGGASHEAYKHRQREAVRRRVLPRGIARAATPAPPQTTPQPRP